MLHECVAHTSVADQQFSLERRVLTESVKQDRSLCSASKEPALVEQILTSGNIRASVIKSGAWNFSGHLNQIQLVPQSDRLKRTQLCVCSSRSSGRSS